MIGYYVHHHGRGHLMRATAIAEALAQPVTGLSSSPRPEGWPGPWVDLPLETDDGAQDPRAHGRLHWAPERDPGLAARMAAIAAWIGRTGPDAIVVDVSVEVTLLARLLGIPVVVVALPGIRTDPAHALGFDVATAILAAWPPGATGMITGLSAAAARRLHPVGAISRLRGAPARRTARLVLVLAGSGGDRITPAAVADAAAATPDWRWQHIGGSSGRWVADPGPLLAAAEVVITHAGENALADVAAARRPAVVLPQERPYAEQLTTARVLADSGWPAVVAESWPEPRRWPELLRRAAALDGDGWASWNDGGGARRAAWIIRRVAERR